jgi:hypothetical protein
MGKLTSASSMFNGANAFNNGGSSTINNWNTANITSVSSMFQGAIAFNQPLNTWNATKFSSLGTMFANATAFNQNLSSWVTNAASQPSNFSTGANATWVASKATTFPFLVGGTVRINT